MRCLAAFFFGYHVLFGSMLRSMVKTVCSRGFVAWVSVSQMPSRSGPTVLNCVTLISLGARPHEAPYWRARQAMR